MSNEMIAMLIQFIILCVFATAIRSINKGESGKGGFLGCTLFCVVYIPVIYVLDTATLIELAPTLRTLVVETTVSSVDAIKSVM